MFINGLTQVTSHICVRLARMADFKPKPTETQLKSHEIEKPLKASERVESELFREVLLKVLALS